MWRSLFFPHSAAPALNTSTDYGVFASEWKWDGYEKKRQFPPKMMRLLTLQSRHEIDLPLGESKWCQSRGRCLHRHRDHHQSRHCQPSIQVILSSPSTPSLPWKRTLLSVSTHALPTCLHKLRDMQRTLVFFFCSWRMLEVDCKTN